MEHKVITICEILKDFILHPYNQDVYINRYGGKCIIAKYLKQEILDILVNNYKYNKYDISKLVDTFEYNIFKDDYVNLTKEDWSLIQQLTNSRGALCIDGITDFGVDFIEMFTRYKNIAYTASDIKKCLQKLNNINDVVKAEDIYSYIEFIGKEIINFGATKVVYITHSLSHTHFLTVVISDDKKEEYLKFEEEIVSNFEIKYPTEFIVFVDESIDEIYGAWRYTFNGVSKVN